MNKHEFFIKGLLSGACKKRAWVMGCFSYIIKDGPRERYEDYPYRLFKIEEDLYFIDPEPINPSPATELLPANLTKIDDYIKGEPLLHWLEPITLAPGVLANYTGTEPLITTPGNLLFNHLALCLPFGDSIPYQTGSINLRKIGERLLELLVDDPEDDDGSPHPEGKIYCRQLLMFNEYALSLTAYAEDNVTPVTPRSLTGHPDRDKRLAELKEQYKGRLSEPAVIAQLGNAFEKLDLEHLAGDASLPFYQSKYAKLIASARKKQFYMYGGEAPFQDGTTVTFIEPPLEAGIDTKELPTMINTQRAGSFNRGFQTRLGGEKTKTIYRMLGTTKVEEGDCGATVGIPTYINPNYPGSYMGFYYLDQGKPTVIDKHNIDQLKGTVVDMREPMACKQDANRKADEPGKGKNICSICAGDSLAELPEGIPAASAAIGGRFLTTFLKKMHGGALKTTKWDYKLHIH